MLAEVLVPPSCWSCGGVAPRRQPLCARCRRLLHRLGPEPVTLGGVRVWAPAAYSGPARDLVRALKFSGATATADAMAAQIAANAPAALLGGGAALLGGEAALPGSEAAPPGGEAALPGTAAPPALVPVPLHPRRRRRRGYNQAALIAAALARRTGLEVVDCLSRSGAAATQVGRDRRERRAGPAGSVAARGPWQAAAGALLVDDVVTTGATLAACAAALAAAGCPRAAAVTFARTIGR
jgi:predicted amidophosphoribosyltransferase